MRPPADEHRPAERVGDEIAGVCLCPLGSIRGSAFPQRPAVGRFSRVPFGDIGAKRGVTQVEDPFDVLTIGEPLKNCAAINKEYVRAQKSEMKI